MPISVYLETTIVSYLTANPSRVPALAEKQRLTAIWWQTRLPLCEAFISSAVIREAAQGNPSAAEKRLAVLDGLTALPDSIDTNALADKYHAALGLPERFRYDSLHLAFASENEVDYLLTWNCAHLAKPQVRKFLIKINVDLGLRTPHICTPMELLGELSHGKTD